MITGEIRRTKEHALYDPHAGAADEVAAMNLNNFVVRPKRRLIEKYTHPAAWFMERRRRKVVYPDFEDQIGSAVLIELVNRKNAADFERFPEKAHRASWVRGARF